MSYGIDRQCTYNGVLYRVLQVLDNDLLLVIPEESSESSYPLQPVVIPDTYVLEERKKLTHYR